MTNRIDSTGTGGVGTLGQESPEAITPKKIQQFFKEAVRFVAEQPRVALKTPVKPSGPPDLQKPRNIDPEALATCHCAQDLPPKSATAMGAVSTCG